MATRIVCVFPGQGAQAVGMGKDLWEADDAVKALYQEANDVLRYDLQRLCFGGRDAPDLARSTSDPGPQYRDLDLGVAARPATRAARRPQLGRVFGAGRVR